MSKHFLPNDTARCGRDDCPKRTKCARWLDKLPWEQYWYNEFNPIDCEGFIEKKDEQIKNK